MADLIANDDGVRTTLAGIHELQVVFNSPYDSPDQGRVNRRLFDIVADEYAHRGGSIPPYVLPCCATVTSGNDPDGVPYEGGRADIRLSLGGDGEIYVLSKSDGMVRLLAGIPPTVAVAASANPNPVTGTITSLSVLGADDGGEANLTYTWSTTGTPPAPVSFSANGTNAAKTTRATFSRAGPYAFQVRITDTSGFSTTSNATVNVQQTLNTVRVSPGTATIYTDGTQQFSATAYDQFNSAMVSQPAFTWSVTSGGGTVSSTGLFVAPMAAGTSVVTASSAGVSGSAIVQLSSGSVGTTIFGSMAPTVVFAGSSSVEMGVKFRSDVSGTITGIRFYKAAGDASTHTGSLWSSTGTLLATGTFSGETPSGWQQMTFSTPIAIAANTTYVATYHTNGALYYSSDFFSNAGFDSGPLHALKDGADGPNGIYGYGTGFPTLTYLETNYWADVMFATN